jgi:hypothetical protein
MRNARVLAENPDRTRQLRRYSSNSVDEREIFLEDLRRVRTDWILPALGRILWRAFVSAIVYNRGAQEAGHFLIIFSNLRLLKEVVLSGVRCKYRRVSIKRMDVVSLDYTEMMTNLCVK